MRLVDKVVNSPPEVELLDGEGRTHRVIGVGAKSDAIKNCPLRYILDPTASDEVGGSSSTRAMDCSTRQVRFFAFPPRPSGWSGSDHPAVTPRRVSWSRRRTAGAGRSREFFESEQGQPDKVPVCVDFDLNGVVRSGQSSDLTIRHNSCLHLNDLLACATARIDPRWDRYFRNSPAAGIWPEPPGTRGILLVPAAGRLCVRGDAQQPRRPDRKQIEPRSAE